MHRPRTHAPRAVFPRSRLHVHRALHQPDDPRRSALRAGQGRHPRARPVHPARHPLRHRRRLPVLHFPEPRGPARSARPAVHRGVPSLGPRDPVRRTFSLFTSLRPISTDVRKLIHLG